jgi:regulator of protease activity HflC (stomatin/prohibitin superfamily)
VVTDGQGVELAFKTSSTFELTSNPNDLNTMNLELCTKYSDGCEDKPETNDDGWGLMLNEYYRKAQESALQTIARKYDTDELMQGDLTEFNQRVADEVEKKVAQNMGGNYLTDITFQIQRPIAPKSVQEKYNAVKAASLQTEVRKQEVNQATQQANAAEELQKTLEDNPQYIEWQRTEAFKEAVDKGQVEFWVLPDTSSIDINK